MHVLCFLCCFRFDDPEFRQKITDEYLHDRSEARRTGLAPKERVLAEYRKWKNEQAEAK